MDGVQHFSKSQHLIVRPQRRVFKQPRWLGQQPDRVSHRERVHFAIVSGQVKSVEGPRDHRQAFGLPARRQPFSACQCSKRRIQQTTLELPKLLVQTQSPEPLAESPIHVQCSRRVGVDGSTARQAGEYQRTLRNSHGIGRRGISITVPFVRWPAFNHGGSKFVHEGNSCFQTALPDPPLAWQAGYGLIRMAP